jgi:phage-related protein
MLKAELFKLDVLHAFQKKTQTTAKRDIDRAKARFAQLMRGEK